MYTGKYLSLERSGIIGKSRDYNDYCCLWSLRLSQILDETNPFEIDKCKSKNGASVSEVLALFNYSSGG